MTHAERILNISKLEKTDRIPLFLMAADSYLNSLGINPKEAQSFTPEKTADLYYDAFTAADSDLSFVGAHTCLLIEALGGKVKWREKGLPDSIEPFLKSADDAKNVDPAIILKNPQIQKLYDITRALVKKENGERFTCCAVEGPFTLAGRLLGVDALMKALYQNRAGIEELLRWTSELCMTYLQGFIDAGAKVVFMPDPCTSADVISKKHFNEISLPAISGVFRRLSAKGMINLLHICGDTTDRLDLIAQSGAHIFSLDHKVKISSAREVFAGKLAFAGNLDPVNFVQFGSHDDIVRETIKGIEDAGENSSYVFMPGCGIPPATPLENLKLISKTVKEYKFN